MRQKYVISRDGAKNKLKIREYAILDKNLKKVASSMLQNEGFSFLCTSRTSSVMECNTRRFNHYTTSS